MLSVLLLYGVCGGCFLLWLFWKPFRRRPRMNLMALFMLFCRVGSLYPAKWKSYLGKHNIDWHIFLRSVVCCNEARIVRPRQKSHWECISTAMRTASFSITGDAKGKCNSTAREHCKWLPSSFMTLGSPRQNWLTRRKTALENSPFVNRVINI